MLLENTLCNRIHGYLEHITGYHEHKNKYVEMMTTYFYSMSINERTVGSGRTPYVPAASSKRFYVESVTTGNLC